MDVGLLYRVGGNARFREKSADLVSENPKYRCLEEESDVTDA